MLIDGLNEIPRTSLAGGQGRTSEPQYTVAGGWVRSSQRVSRQRFACWGSGTLDWCLSTTDRVQEYVQSNLKGDSGKELIRELRRLPRLLALCRNPLLLYMLVDLSSEKVAIPSNRGRLLDEFMTRFLNREEPQIAPISARTMRLLLSGLAFEMRCQRTVSILEAEVVRHVQERVSELQAGVGAVDVVEAMEGAKLLHQVGDGRVAFFHELIQEYFAAKELSGTTEVRQVRLEGVRQ